MLKMPPGKIAKINEIWSLAEYFDITEDYIKKALTLYEEKLLYCKE